MVISKKKKKNHNLLLHCFSDFFFPHKCYNNRKRITEQQKMKIVSFFLG